MSILSTFTDNRRGKVAASVIQLGKPSEQRSYDSADRGKLCTFFCGLGLPYMPLKIDILQAAYHAIAGNAAELLAGLKPLLLEALCREEDVNSEIARIMKRYNEALGAGVVVPAEPMAQSVAAVLGEPVMKPVSVLHPKPDQSHNELASKAAQSIADLIASATNKPQALDETKVISLIRKHAQATEIRIVSDKGATVIPTGLHHTILPEVLVTLKAGVNVYLVGPAGSGKTTLAIQLAKALGVDFHFNGALDSEYKLTGFMDAQGRYVRTAFRNAYENGGLYLFDELDASAASALLAFNAALGNGHSDFPDGCIKMHKDFYCIAAANTYGTGADRVYIGRNQLDGAFLDRFAFIEMNYDEKLERAVAGNDSWVDYVQGVRRAIKTHKIRHIVSPRASIKGAMLLSAGMRQERVEALLIWKGLDSDTVTKIRNAA